MKPFLFSLVFLTSNFAGAQVVYLDSTDVTCEIAYQQTPIINNIIQQTRNERTGPEMTKLRPDISNYTYERTYGQFEFRFSYHAGSTYAFLFFTDISGERRSGSAMRLAPWIDYQTKKATFVHNWTQSPSQAEYQAVCGGPRIKCNFSPPQQVTLTCHISDKAAQGAFANLKD